ncbi:response regulator transcription factor [Sporosarcina sp. G11-34]|uniref:response regulator transcription factor n=1 Tax=Sporosarcina sp. G11-34 TaxID=2849605 RepID=UPI0022A8E608|nr:response regulator transcription factor [Sporosarcina sp. G11-34]MCZ2257421.1 response regulator transcription factor [Sporosarcina sp. G11-34]
MANERILVVDDEVGIRELIRLYLKKKKYSVLGAANGKQAIEIVRNEQIDLILLDIEMPGMTGFDVCKRIREFSSIPILFISCKKELADRIEGIEIGADDYITKPFDFHELKARIEAIFRRNKWLERDATDLVTSVLKFDDIQIDLHRCELIVRGEKVVLSNKEFQLLVLMAKEPNRIWPAEQLYDQIWGYYSEGSPQTVKVHISNLRRKLELNPADPKYIQTARGFGYRFALAK